MAALLFNTGRQQKSCKLKLQYRPWLKYSEWLLPQIITAIKRTLNILTQGYWMTFLLVCQVCVCAYCLKYSGTELRIVEKMQGISNQESDIAPVFVIKYIFVLNAIMALGVEWIVWWKYKGIINMECKQLELCSCICCFIILGVKTVC